MSEYQRAVPVLQVANVETSLRNIDQLINEVNRKWPFARDTELKLP